MGQRLRDCSFPQANAAEAGILLSFPRLRASSALMFCPDPLYPSNPPAASFSSLEVRLPVDLEALLRGECSRFGQ
jgi:hypothetical protein